MQGRFDVLTITADRPVILVWNQISHTFVQSFDLLNRTIRVPADSSTVIGLVSSVGSEPLSRETTRSLESADYSGLRDVTAALIRVWGVEGYLVEAHCVRPFPLRSPAMLAQNRRSVHDRFQRQRAIELS